MLYLNAVPEQEQYAPTCIACVRVLEVYVYGVYMVCVYMCVCTRGICIWCVCLLVCLPCPQRKETEYSSVSTSHWKTACSSLCVASMATSHVCPSCPCVSALIFVGSNSKDLAVLVGNGTL